MWNFVKSLLMVSLMVVVARESMAVEQSVDSNTILGCVTAYRTNNIKGVTCLAEQVQGFYDLSNFKDKNLQNQIDELMADPWKLELFNYVVGRLKDRLEAIEVKNRAQDGRLDALDANGSGRVTVLEKENAHLKERVAVLEKNRLPDFIRGLGVAGTLTGGFLGNSEMGGFGAVMATAAITALNGRLGVEAIGVLGSGGKLGSRVLGGGGGGFVRFQPHEEIKIRIVGHGLYLGYDDKIEIPGVAIEQYAISGGVRANFLGWLTGGVTAAGGVCPNDGCSTFMVTIGVGGDSDTSKEGTSTP